MYKNIIQKLNIQKKQRTSDTEWFDKECQNITERTKHSDKCNRDTEHDKQKKNIRR